MSNLRWAVVWVRLNPTEGHEQKGTRPALVVVSFEPFHSSGLASVIPITSARIVPRFPGDVAIGAGEGGLKKAGVIVCHQLRVISLERVAPQRTVHYLLDPRARERVRDAVAHHLGLDMRAQKDGASGSAKYGEK